MLSYPLVNTSISAFDTDHILTSSGYASGGGSAVSNFAQNAVGSIPVVGDLLGGALNFLGVDFNCINASFPPEKAQQETTAFVAEKIRESKLDHLIATNASLKTVEDTANKLLITFSAGEYNRKLTGDGASGCTKDGEYVSMGIFKNAKQRILSALESVFDISIKNTFVDARSGFRGGLVRSNPTPLVTIHARKGSPVPKNDDSSNSGSNTDTDSTTDSNDLTGEQGSPIYPSPKHWSVKEILVHVLLFLLTVVLFPILLYKTLKKKK
ncbi:hypothetical protein [uncultured Tenacibaculum sp.]|uniref:hypothetical protein n=1 Tax=uncultured Tenacibaculum sp. TaxID=174713 RepID=UPI00260DB3DC|nr:hypothetical protein [uncultured Tenacibaculum sp.]